MKQMSEIRSPVEDLTQKALDLLDKREYKMAIDIFEQILKIDNRNITALINKGFALSKLGKLNEAISSYDKALEISPNEVNAWIYKGEAVQGLEKYEEAVTYYDKALEINPKISRAWSGKGDVLVRLGKYEEAITRYDKALEIGPYDTYALSGKGYAFFSLGKYEEAVKFYDKALEIDPSDASALTGKGDALQSLEKYEEAVTCYDIAIKLYPDEYYPWSSKGSALQSLSKYEEAIKCYDKALEINPGDQNAWNGKADSLAELGDFDHAIKWLGQVIATNPNEPWILAKRAFLFEKIKDIESAMQDYEKALKIDPKFPLAVEGKARLTGLSQKAPLSEEIIKEEPPGETKSKGHKTKLKPGVLLEGEIPSKKAVGTYNYDSVKLYPDNPTEEDSLSRSALAELLAHRMIKVREQNPTGSFLINLDGPWGSGKSSFLKLLKKELLKSNDSEKKSVDWLVVEFNAWQNQRIQNPWWSLKDSVSRQLAAHLYENNYPRYIKIAAYEGVWRLGLRRGRLFALITFILFLSGMIFLFGGLDFSNLPKLTEAGEQVIEYIQKISGIVAVIGSFISGILLLRNTLFPARTDVEQLLQSFEDPMKRLSDHFKEYIDKIKVPVVVFIDDLDRCNEKYTVDFLDGLQTIFRDAHVIYIVAADKRWIYSAYEKTYATFLSVGEPARTLGQLFLAKIFQMSVPIPKMSPDLRKRFYSSLLEVTKPQDEKSKDEKRQEEKMQEEKMQEEKRQEAVVNQIQEKIKSYDNNQLIQYSMQRKGDDAQATTKAVLRTLEEREFETEENLQKFEHLLEPNPRAIKRLLNTFVIYRAIAIMKRVNLDFDKLTLWTIITMRWPLLGDYLLQHPRDIEKLDNPSELPAEDIKKLLKLDKAQILNVIRGKKIGKHLDAKAIEKLADAI